MIYIFLDTNVCLHFTSFESYPWSTHFDKSETLTIVITHPLIEELDKKKYSGKNHLKKRATTNLKLIENLSSLDSTHNIEYTLYNEVITKQYVESKGLDPADGDDRLIAAILKFKESRPNINITFISNDLGPRLKIQKYSIDAIQPNPKHQLKNPESDLDKSLKRLQIENEKLKKLSPKLSITFQDNTKLIKFEIEKINDNIDDFVETEMQIIKESLSRFKLKDELEKEREEERKRVEEEKKSGVYDQHAELRKAILSMSLHGLGGIREEDKVEYNDKLSSYYLEYEQYLRLLYEYNVQRSLTIEFNLELNNDGTVPAEDIDIYFHFPDGFELFDEDSYPKEPEIPREPYKPRSIFDTNFSLPNLAHLNMPTNYNVPYEKPNISSPSIKKTNSYDVNIHVGKLKHNKIAVMEKMYVLFENYNSIINYEVNYEIRCSNVPDIVKGNLNFINELKDGI